MEKFKNIAYKTILAFLILFLVISTFYATFNIYHSQFKLNSFIIILGTIIIFSLFITIKKFIASKKDKTLNYIALSLCFLFFILLSIFGSFYLTNPNTDLNNIQSALFYMLDNKKVISDINYFSIYSMQTPVAILLYYVYKIGSLLGFSNLKLFATIFNALSISIAALFTYLSVKKISTTKTAFLSILFFIINPIWYFYCPYFYTDTLCIPFAAIGIYLFIIGINYTNKKSIISLIGSGLFLALGSEIRVIVTFLLIAMIMSLFLSIKSYKQIFKKGLLLCAGFALGIFSYKLIELPFNVKVNKDLQFPIYHWIMMGLNEENKGKYNDMDYYLTKNAGNYNQKVEANIKEIKSRIKNLGPFGLLKHGLNKISVNWSNGDYQFRHRLKNVESTPNSYEYIVGNNAIFTNYYYQICKTVILISTLILTILELKKPNPNIKFIIIALFGSFIFHLIWEVKERYSLSFLPWMILLFGLTIDNLSNLSSSYIKKSNIEKYSKYLSYGLIIITTALLITNFYKYSIKTSTFNDTVITQYSDRKDKIETIDNKKITQTFIANKDFNTIKIKFINKSNDETNYRFTLKDAKNKDIYIKDFSSKEVTDNKWYTFKFNKQKVTEETTYSLEIYSTDATKENSLGIMSYFYEGYKIYPNGTLLANDHEIKYTSLTFKVENANQRVNIPGYVYISISILILGIEIIALYPYLKCKRK